MARNPTNPSGTESTRCDELATQAVRGRPLLRKYATTLVTVVCGALCINGALDMWFSYQEQKSLLVRIQRGQAEAAAANISQFIKEIEGQIGWATLLPWSSSTFEEWRFDAVRLLRQVPAVTEVAQLDATGHELFRVSRHARDVVGSHTDFSGDPVFVQAIASKVYHGPVYFVGGSEPYMALAMAGIRRNSGVIVAQVNLKFIWDVVSQIKVGKGGRAYVIDAQGRLIAHPDISLVLRNTDLSRLPQVAAARTRPSSDRSDGFSGAIDFDGGPVLSAHAPVSTLNWLVFVELPMGEALAPVYNSIIRAGASFLAALLLALFAGLLLARRMVVPIRTLHDGAVRIGSGDLAHRISIKTGDELEALGDQFNSMASRLEESYSTLEQKVTERTRQLETANLAKSRFLAAASHDLRQPLHALVMFVAQLNDRMRAPERRKIVARIETALGAMNELFSALLDISKLDAGVLKPHISEFPILRLLNRIEATFAGPAREKALGFRVVSSDAWVRSDFILLERIAFNLVSNAVRYTNSGGILVGCRRRGEHLHVEVWDTGIGIPSDQHHRIFDEFYRLGEPDRDRRGGLGLGLAIVERLCRMLDHPIHLRSTVGRGSRLSVAVPSVGVPREVAEPLPATSAPIDIAHNKVVLVIDDDVLVQESMSSLFRTWGCRVISLGSDEDALRSLSESGQVPDLIVSDYHLPGGKTGLEVIERVRGMMGVRVPAFLISGDINPEPLRQARGKGFQLLHKPVEAMELRVLLNQALLATQSKPEAKAPVTH